MSKRKSKDRLKEALSIRGMKQSEVAQKTGISKSALSQYVSGTIEPRQNNVYLLSKVLNVSEAWLMGYDVPMEREKNKIDMFNKKEQIGFDKFIDDAIYYFNDEHISDEDKEKLFQSLQEVYFTMMLDKKLKK